MTTNRLIPIQAIARDASKLVHLTGSVQMVARVTLGGPDQRAAHVEVWLDAMGVRGVGLQAGVRYQARGAYRVLEDPPELPAPFLLVSAFELLRYGTGDRPPACLVLILPFRLTVQRDGRVIVGMEEPTLLPCPGG